VSKARKPKKPARRPWRSLLAVGLTLAAVAGLLYGLGRLGDEARRRVGPRDRYLVQFADIESDAPPGLARPKFLAEVRYVGQLPETFNLNLAADTDRLSAAFAAHPWVKAVEGIDVEPPARVRVRLQFRVPVLAVKTQTGGVRLVDADAVLLPPAERAGLPELLTVLPDPAVPAGQVWADTTVRRAVELVAAYQPRSLEKSPTGWRLTTPDGKVLVIGP
jgi:hypothetical protein